MKQGRIYWIDWAKAISIYAVILIHLHVTETIRESLLLWVNGLFFLISGYLYKKNTFKKELLKSIQSIFIPLIIYATGIMILYTVKNGLDYNFFYNLSILNFTKLVGIFAPICPLWFLTALFLMRVLTATSKFAPVILIFIDILIFMLFKAPREYNVFMSTTTLLCYPYFYIGIILKSFDLINKICNIIETRLLWIKYMLLPAFTILIILGLLNGKTDMVQCNYGENGFIFFPISFLLCLIIITFCYFYLNKYNTYITHTSSGTMMILAIHYPIYIFRSIPVHFPAAYKA